MLDAYLDILFDGVAGFLSAAGIFCLFIYVVLTASGKLQPRSGEALLLLSPILVFFALLIPGLCWAFLVLAWLAAKFLFDPHMLFLSLPLFALVWLRCRLSTSRPVKIISETLQPWLIGMAIVGVVFLAARTWLPRAQWPWIFTAEKVASWCEITFDSILPHSATVNIILLTFFFAINLLGPNWQKWTGRTQKALSRAKSAAAVLAVITSCTFFGSGQAGALLEATAEEKYNRLVDQTTARAELILAARISDHVTEESNDISKFLDSVYQGVSLDLKIPLRMGEYPPIYMSDSEFEKWRLQEVFNNRVSELRDAIARNPTVTTLAEKFDRATLASMLGRYFSDDEIKDAKDKFDKALDKFVESNADWSVHPLSKMLVAAGLPDLVPAIIKDLYKSEVSSFAKKLTNPLVDNLFQVRPIPAEVTIARFTEIAQHPIFDPASLPAVLVTPTYQDRVTKKEIRRIEIKAVEDAIRDVK